MTVGFLVFFRCQCSGASLCSQRCHPLMISRGEFQGQEEPGSFGIHITVFGLQQALKNARLRLFGLWRDHELASKKNTGVLAAILPVDAQRSQDRHYPFNHFAASFA